MQVEGERAGRAGEMKAGAARRGGLRVFDVSHCLRAGVMRGE